MLDSISWKSPQSYLLTFQLALIYVYKTSYKI